MAKRKFNKEERNAIIQKLEKIAKEREQQSWEDCRKAYKPSEVYIKAEALLTARNEACKALKELGFYFFTNWNTFEQINKEQYLNKIIDEEIEPLVTKYRVDRTNLEVEIILMNQDDPVDELIEKLLEDCLCK
jgi:hypothetical protein